MKAPGEAEHVRDVVEGETGWGDGPELCWRCSCGEDGVFEEDETAMEAAWTDHLAAAGSRNRAAEQEGPAALV